VSNNSLGNDAQPLPEWESVANALDALLSGPTQRQRDVAARLGVELPDGLPAQVIAALLRGSVSEALLSPEQLPADIPESLGELEDSLELPRTTELIAGTRDEVSAWFAARYAFQSMRGLRAVRPDIGDVVTSSGWEEGEHRIVSSIGSDGRVYMRHLPSRRAWPSYLTVVARLGSEGHALRAAAVDASIRNATTSRSTNFANYQMLAQYELRQHRPSPEAVRELENLLESGERREEPYQQLITRNPEFLAMTVVGGWKTFVIPKARLGTEHVTDFLVLGINSVGPQWLTVELEAPRHRILTQAGRLSSPTRHAIDQVHDWREWLTQNVAYAQSQLGLHGITNRSPGLIVIGRDDPSPERRASRSQSAEEGRIEIHSWDWLLRHVTNAGRYRAADFAYENLRDQSPALRQTAAVQPQRASLDLNRLLHDVGALDLDANSF